jgi:hypothetical protein
MPSVMRGIGVQALPHAQRRLTSDWFSRYTIAKELNRRAR